LWDDCAERYRNERKVGESLAAEFATRAIAREQRSRGPGVSASKSDGSFFRAPTSKSRSHIGENRFLHAAGAKQFAGIADAKDKQVIARNERAIIHTKKTK
jgi:hypothetical protein